VQHDGELAGERNAITAAVTACGVVGKSLDVRP